jgi:hypothetical protein
MAAGRRLGRGGGRPGQVVLLTTVAGQRQERTWARSGRAEGQAQRMYERENRFESVAADAGTSARFWVKSLNFRQSTRSR